MFDSTVLGVDPGVSAMGLATVTRRERGWELLACLTVRTPAKLAEADRLRLVHEAVVGAIAVHRPGAVAVALCHLAQSRLRRMQRLAT